MTKLSLFKDYLHIRDIQLSEIFEIIRKELLKDNVNKYRNFIREGKEEEATLLKKKLEAFTSSGTFQKRRIAECLVEYSRLIILDYDKIPPDILETIIKKVTACEFTRLSFISPSGKGLKIIVEVSGDKDSHQNSYYKVANYYDHVLSIKCDRSGKDITRLCYLSSDPSAYYNPDSNIFDVAEDQQELVTSSISNSTQTPLNPNISKSDFVKDSDLAFKECEEFTRSKCEFVNGSRNKFVYFLACNCNRKGISEESATKSILEKYGYKVTEVEKSVKSAFKNIEEHGKGFNAHNESIFKDIASEPSQPPAQVKTTQAHSFKEMIRRFDSEPKPVFLWKGIKKGSFGFLIGAAKSGKTTLAEGLALHIASGKLDYLGFPIGFFGSVFLAFMEEHWLNRTERFKDQLSNFTESEKTACLDKIKTIDENFPRVINDEKTWNMLEEAIKDSGGDIVILDSLTRFTGGKIEESSDASKIVLRLRNLAEKLGVTMICIHHTPKQSGKPLTIESVAGSRVLGAEADFIIGINKVKNIRYIKDIAFRYLPEDEKVVCFEISDTRMIITNGPDYEDAILNQSQSKSNDQDDSENMIFECITSIAKNETFANSGDLQHELVSSKKMSRSTLFEKLKSLEKKGKIIKEKKGIYKLFPQDQLKSDLPQDGSPDV